MTFYLRLFFYVVLLTATLPLYGQLSKSFDNEKEWQLSYELYFNFENAQASAKVMDSILLLTREPDKRILYLGIGCYLKTNQEKKAFQVLTELTNSNYISPCDHKEYVKMFDVTCEAKDSVQFPDLKEELINMLIIDQYYRGVGFINHLGSIGYEVHHDSLLEYSMGELDLQNQKRLKKMFLEYGFPNEKMVGQLGIIAVKMVLQHSDNDVAFQKQYLPEVKKMHEEGVLLGSDYAYLQDRVLINEEKPQIYGTQVIPEDIKPHINYQPMEKPEEVNLRRMKLGMMPIERYLSRF